MDATVFVLYLASAVLTVGGLVVATVELASRVRTYRARVVAAAERASTRFRSEILEMLKGRSSEMVAMDLRGHIEATAAGFDNLAEAAGVKITGARLWLSAAVALVGVLMGVAADLLATVRAPG